MSHPSRFEWLGFFVHFVFGAGLGFVAWSKFDEHLVSSSSSFPAFVYLGGGAIVCGTLAGFAGDGFWRGVAECFRL